MAELSPAAQAVLDAYNREAKPEPHHQREAIAAALRAAADKVAPKDFAYDSGSLADGALEFEQGQDCRNEAIRWNLLAIATELESHQGNVLVQPGAKPLTDLKHAATLARSALEGWANHGYWVWPESDLEQAKRNTTEALAALNAALAEELSDVGKSNHGFVIRYTDGFYDMYSGYPVILREATRYNTRKEAEAQAEAVCDVDCIEEV